MMMPGNLAHHDESHNDISVSNDDAKKLATTTTAAKGTSGV